MRMFPPQMRYHPVVRWSDCIGQDRDSCHLGTLSTILQHFIFVLILVTVRTENSSQPPYLDFLENVMCLLFFASRANDALFKLVPFRLYHYAVQK